jgi:hypothetical protein
MASALSPRQLFRLLDEGGITREQFRAAIAVHTRRIIDEMVEARRNPLADWIETQRNRRAARRLVHRHGEPIVRELLVALADVPGFPLADWLWNADSPRVPLYCLLRSTCEPVFRVMQITASPFLWIMTAEHGSAGRGRAVREKFTFARDRFGRMFVQGRERLG